MSILEPLSDERTARTSPTWDSRMARMSSIRGPGQKLPRASIVRGAAAVAVGSGVVSSIARSFLDEERGVGLGHDLDGGRGAGRLGHAVDEVLVLEAEH